MMTTIPTTLSDTTLHYTSPMITTPTAVSKTTTEMHLATEDHPLSTHYEVRPEVSIRPSEVQDVAVGEIITITCHTTRRLDEYNYQWTVNGTLVPTQRSPVFRYEAVSGVHKVKCKVTSSGGETESEDSTVTVLPEGTITFTSSIRITGRNFTPEMANPNSDDFKTISTEIKDWYRQAMTSVQGSMFIRVKDAKPGSVITSQNINLLNPDLQDNDLYDDIYRALRTAVRTPDSLGMDPTSLTLLSTTTCYGETVSVTDQYSNRVNLTFPSIAGDTHAYSREKCANNTESAGVPLAVRRCTGSFDTGVSWSSPELLDCGLDLSRLAQIPVTPENVAEVAADLQILTSNGSSLMAENIADASTVLDNLANTTGDQNVGYSVMVSVDQIMNSDDEVLYQSQVKDQSLSRIVRAIEQFNDRVNLTTKRFRRVEQNIGVETYKIGAAELINSVGFSSLDGSEDLEDGSVRSYSDSSSIPNDRVDASIVLPAELASTIAFMRENLPDSSDVEVRLSFIIYQNSRLFQSNQTASSSKTRVNSRIIASRVTGFDFKNLSSPVVTRYLPVVQNSTNRTVDNVRCVFWDFQAEGGAGAWSTEGCDFVGIDNSRVVCECNHLTNFAVLTDIYGGLQSIALDLISKVGIALSITGLTLTLITYVIFKQLRQTRPQHILTHLCSALLATLVIFLAGIDATSSPVGCTVVSFLLHYFLLAVFMWMAVEAFNMYLAFVIVLGAHVSRFMLKAAIFAWGLPLVIAIVTLAVDIPSTYPNEQETYRSSEFCWLQGNQLYFGFLLPAGLVLLFNTIVYIVVISKLVCGRNEGRVVDHKSGATKQNLRIAIAVMVLVGLTWVFGFFMISDGRIVFSYLFCIFNSLQGFFIFIFHTLRQKEVQNLWFKCCACFVDDARTTKTSAGKSSSNLVESNEESYSRGAQRGNAPESVPMEVYME
ncbi:adhesion G-protein coupled receptor G7-like [Branchiostoma floridae]|uniref:Adhesion G-protein coupled receptor G7-like n=1 Tax=Branchiostoma floridae TaxID=7739 RepID=A0A9J7HW92_BRAFL|nr:adhesion G-protein coupled receptor G7-like [Branchiostoma floridae]